MFGWRGTGGPTEVAQGFRRELVLELGARFGAGTDPGRAPPVHAKHLKGAETIFGREAGHLGLFWGPGCPGSARESRESTTPWW
jgi:hypothetical protein